MKKSKFLPTLFLAGAAMFGTNTAMAISLDFVAGGSASDVDIVISGLSAAGEIVTAYDLGVNYDAGANTATGVSFAPGTPFLDPLFFGFFALSSSDLATAGVAGFSALSLWDDLTLDLFAGQGDGFTLATLSFDSAVDLGSLSFDWSAGQYVVGRAAQAILPVVDVPVPATALLMGLGLVGFMVSGSRRRRSASVAAA